MDPKITQQFITVYMQAGRDEDYRKLLAEFRELEQRLLEQLETMDAQQRSAVLDYLGLTGQMHRKLLEYACSIAFREGQDPPL